MKSYKKPAGKPAGGGVLQFVFWFDFCCRGTAAEMRAEKPVAILYIIRVRVREFLRTC